MAGLETLFSIRSLPAVTSIDVKTDREFDEALSDCVLSLSANGIPMSWIYCELSRSAFGRTSSVNIYVRGQLRYQITNESVQ